MKSTVEHANAFVEQVDQWVIVGLRSGARDFTSLLRTLPGIYPTEVVDSLRRLQENPAVAESARAILLASESDDSHFAGWRPASRLPTPHPLDYDWRFTVEAIETLLLNCDDCKTGLICLGSPTVFVSAIERFGRDRVVLFDQNAAAIRRSAEMLHKSRAIQIDVFADSVPAIHSDVVVADPPWYLEHMKAFLWFASKMCCVGGRVLMSIPPHGTRPTVAAELDQVFAYARRLGLSFRRIQEDCLAYETPPFESNALRAAGCEIVRGTSWRRGTLCIFQRIASVNLKRPKFYRPTARWMEADLHGTRFRFRCQDRDRIGFNDPALIPLVAGDILPSVSRRHHLRAHADVWSSGNRVFRCEGSHILHQIVELLAKKTSPDAIPSSLKMPLTKLAAQQVQRAAVHIEHVAAMERAERRFIGRG